MISVLKTRSQQRGGYPNRRDDTQEDQRPNYESDYNSAIGFDNQDYNRQRKLGTGQGQRTKKTAVPSRPYSAVQ